MKKFKQAMKEKLLETPLSDEDTDIFCPRIHKILARYNEIKAKREKAGENCTTLEAEFVMAYIVLFLDVFYPKGKCFVGPTNKVALAKSHQKLHSNTNWKIINNEKAHATSENQEDIANNNNTNDNKSNNNTAKDTQTTKQVLPPTQQVIPDLWDKSNHLCTGDLFDGELDEVFQYKIKRYFQKDIDKLNKAHGTTLTTQDVPVAHVFDELSFVNVPNYTINSLLNWVQGNRPGVVMTYAPTPRKLFDLMCDQKRCVSCLITPEELQNVILDDYPPFEKRNVLSFLFHDIKHLEKFVDPSFYLEQVAFLKFMRPLSSRNVEASHGFREDFITIYDEEFAADTDHLLADMNACSPHLMQFLKAKWIDGEYRRCVREEPAQTGAALSASQLQRLHSTTFDELFAIWKRETEKGDQMPQEKWEELRASFDKICTPDYKFADSEKIRQFFVDYAQLVVN